MRSIDNGIEFLQRHTMAMAFSDGSLESVTEQVPLFPVSVARSIGG